MAESQPCRSGSRLTPVEARKLALLVRVLAACVVGSGFALLAGIAALLLPAGATLRAVAWGLFLELAVSAAVLGGLFPCPACRGRLATGKGGRLLPARCPHCGVRLGTDAAQRRGRGAATHPPEAGRGAEE